MSVTVARASLALALGLVLGAAPARAHVGSPDTWFEGAAGPYPVRVVVRAPGVVPGLAEISVRVLGGTPTRVTVQPFAWNAGAAGAPPPDVAKPVPGDAGLFGVQLWFMSPTAYGVHVQVEGDRGPGMAIVPVQATATRRLPMERGMSWTLIALGAFLLFGMATFVGAALRESVVPPGAAPDARHRRLGRIGAIATALVLLLAIAGGRSWWNSVDRGYRSEMERPFHITTLVKSEGGARALTIALDDPDWMGQHWTPLIPDHGKLMHLFLVREPALDAMAHLHPVMRDSSHFASRLPAALPAGRYRAYADVVHESGFARTMIGAVDVPALGATVAAAAGSAAADPLPPADSDDSWSVGASAAPDGAAERFTFPNGITMTWDREARLEAGRGDRPLRFEVRLKDGAPAFLMPYLGMVAHAVVTRDDGAVFAHLHPTGTAPMASQLALAMRTPADTANGALGRRITALGDAGGMAGMSGMAAMPAAGHGDASGVITIPYGFPSPGRYRLWVQVKLGDEVRTAEFDAVVK